MIIPLLLVLLYTLGYYWRFQTWQTTVFLAIGLAVGWAFYVLDAKVLAKYYADPGQPLKPVSRSLWLLLLYWPLAIFVATSTGSLLGLGLVLGLGAGLSWDILRLHRSVADFKTYFQIPSHSQLTQLEIQVASWIWGLAFVILAASYLW